MILIVNNDNEDSILLSQKLFIRSPFFIVVSLHAQRRVAHGIWLATPGGYLSNILREEKAGIRKMEVDLEENIPLPHVFITGNDSFSTSTSLNVDSLQWFESSNIEKLERLNI